MNRRLVAGNWKMNMNQSEAIGLLTALKNDYKNSETQLVVCPSYIHLSLAVEHLKGSGIKVGAQDCSANEKGAFTGEVSVEMLKSYEVEYVILGHSERRQYHQESDELINQKVKAVLKAGMKAILCVGELLEERKSGNYIEIITKQLEKALSGITSIDNVVIAYEPVWAIGTGETASANQAQEVHAVIRKWLIENYSDDAANEVSILYGGSCKPGNAKELFANADVDGGLIGGAALKSEDFIAIANSY